MPRIRRRPKRTVKTYSFPRPYYIPLVFNVRHPVLKRTEVRRAHQRSPRPDRIDPRRR